MGPLFQLDTNILVHYVREDLLWTSVRDRFSLFTIEPIPQISIVSLGEIQSLQLTRNWSGVKLDRLEYALKYFKVVAINPSDTVSHYAAIDSDCRSRGFKLGKNDLWIAATAVATGATLISTDRDFERVNPALISWLWIDPQLSSPGAP